MPVKMDPPEESAVHDRRAIRARRIDGGTVRGIAREIGASRNAVRRAIDPEAHERYRRPSLSEQFEPAVRDVLADDPRATLAKVADLIAWPGARQTLGDLVAKLRPAALEREREGLQRPSVGVMRVGRVVVGVVRTGSDHAEAVQAGPTRAA